MPRDDSTNLQPPDFGPGYPLFPELPQLVRASGGKDRNGKYPGFVQQSVGGMTLRDREPCYIFEPNGVALSPAIYDCRLVDSYNGLPLYCTCCCVSGSSSSSSPGH